MSPVNLLNHKFLIDFLCQIKIEISENSDFIGGHFETEN